MKKAIIAALLAIALVLAVFPYGVFAANTGLTVTELGGKYIYGIPEKTTIPIFVGVYQSANYKIKNLSGSEVSGNETMLGTGFTLSYSETGTSKTLSFVVLGDVDGNGRVTSGDYLNIRAHLRNTAPLGEVPQLAADINDDKAISTFDYMLIKAHFMGTYDIYSGQKDDDSSADSSAVVTPDPWTSGWA